MKKYKLSSYFLKYKFGIFSYIFFTILGCVCTFLMTVFTAKAIEVITTSNFKGAINMFAVVLIITLVRRLCYFINAVLYDVYSTKIILDLNIDLAKQSFKLDSKTFSDHNTGMFVQRIVSDPDNIVNSLSGLVNMMAGVFTLFITLIYITTLNVYVGTIISIILVVSIIVEHYRIKSYRKNIASVKKESDNITSLTTEIVKSEKDIKALGIESQLESVSKERYGRYSKAVYRLESTSTKFWTSRSLFIEVSVMLLLIFAIVLMERSILTLATFILIQSNSSTLGDLVWNFGGIMDRIIDVKNSSARMFEIFDEDEFTTEKFGNVNLENVNGSIQFKNVNFEYKDYEYSKDKNNKQKTKKLVSTTKVFEDLSFTINQNTTVAFVGRSGSGKSTILNLMSKMMEVDSGEVLIDDVNINDLNKETLRNSIALVSQFPYIFDMSIKDNLLLVKSNASDEEIMNALKQASLYDFVQTLPKGVNTIVGESGVKLSGGQRQRLAIARALLKNSAIILFDESTSSLDNFAQEEIKRSIDAIKGKSTVVIVAHRLSTIKDADVIYFLEDGKIIDSGTFDYLYKNNEKFEKMFLVENMENN